MRVLRFLIALLIEIEGTKDELMEKVSADAWYATKHLDNDVTYIGEPYIKAFYRCNIWHV